MGYEWTCHKCGQLRDESEFYASGEPAHCKICERERQKKRSKIDTREFRQRKVIAQFKHRHGITLTPEQIDEMEEEQNHRCAICERKFSELKRQYCIDHDHETLEIRGLLCRPCNLTVGYIEKAHARLENIAHYLGIE